MKEEQQKRTELNSQREHQKQDSRENEITTKQVINDTALRDQEASKTG
jgi:hypothetical protein